MKKILFILKLCCLFLIINCYQIQSYNKICDSNIARFEILKRDRNFAYTYQMVPQGIFAGLPRKCGVELAQQDRATLSQVLAPKANLTLEQAMNQETDNSGVVFNVLRDFKQNTRVRKVQGILNKLELNQ